MGDGDSNPDLQAPQLFVRSLFYAAHGFMVVPVATKRLLAGIALPFGYAVITDFCQQPWTAAVREFGRVDILLANAGICISGPFLESTMEQYDEQMDTNMRSMYAICLHALPEMLKLDESQLIVVSSVTGHVGHANEVAYSATKFANRGFAQALNNEYRSQGLKVCCLCPSAANTMFDIGRARTVESNNASLMLLPEDIAEAVVFVCRQPARTSRVMEMSLASMAGN